MARTVKQKRRERERAKKAALKKHFARRCRGPAFSVSDFHKRLKAGLKRAEKNAKARLANPYLRKAEGGGLLSCQGGLLRRKKGPK